MKKILNKKLDEKAMLAGIFAFAALGFLYLYVAATVNNTEAPTKEIPQPQSTATTQDVQSSKSGMKKYRSNLLRVEFEYPGKYVIEQVGQFINLVDSDSKKITLSRSGSMFNNVNDHVDDSVKKWYQEPVVRNEIIGIFQKGQLVEKSFSGAPYRIIYFVKNNFVYQFETGDASLFSDLETIAKSFTILE